MPSLKNKTWIIIAILVFLIIGVWALRLETNTGFSPSVLLVSIDSLRPDHLGCYGYLKNTSPNIDKLAKKGVVFTQAIAQGSWTLPSTASIVTSSYPSTHKVYTWDAGLPTELPTLARLLKDQGFYSFFCSGHNKTLSAILGEQGGFDSWTRNENLINAGKVNEYALKFLRKNYKRKFFLWIHYMDTHDYFIGASNKKIDFSSGSFKNTSLSKYDAAIAQVDKQIGILIDELKELKIDKNTLIIITADHGEEICEHGICFNHGGFLWDSLIRVPLIMVWDGHLPVNKISPMQVQHIDIASTICDLLKIKKPALFEGQSLLSIFDGRKLFPHPVFSEHQERQGDVSSGAWVYSKYSVRRDNWKLIYTLHPKGKAYELYNLKDDPSELNNLNRASILTEKEKTEFEILKQELAVWSRRKKPKVRPAARSLDERTKEKLKGLGYLN